MIAAKLRFDVTEISYYAERYDYQIADDYIIDLRPTIQERGYLTKDDLYSVARWKAPRSAGHVAKNSDDYIEEITRFCFASQCERAKIQILTNLDGVSWPTASVLLHLYDKKPYPILDFRALWSVSLDVPSYYNFDFWWPYVEYCRNQAGEANVDMRTLDKALWQYSKEYQFT